MKWYLFLLAFAAIFPQIIPLAHADSLGANIQILSISDTAVPDQFDLSMKICAGDATVMTPVITVTTDMGTQQMTEQSVIGPHGCVPEDIRIEANDGRSVTVSSPGMTTTYAPNSLPPPPWFENLNTWYKAGLISAYDYDNCVAYLKQLGIF